MDANVQHAFVQGSEHEARKRVPADMAPPWKVSHVAHAKHSRIHVGVIHDFKEYLLFCEVVTG